MKDSFQFIDLLTFDPSSAAEFGIPGDRCKGMILLFPLAPNDKEEDRCIDVVAGQPKFIKQTIGNSCCLMALLHLLLNNPAELLNQSELPEIVKTLQYSRQDSEKLMENSSELKQIHEEMAKAGGTDLPALEDNIPFHFVALMPFNGAVWLMDGRRAGPIKFPNSGNFFETACKIAKEDFVQKSDDQTNFAAVILV